MREDPPALISGSGTPSTGRSPTTTLMLTSAWPTIQAMMPPVTTLTYRSLLRRIMRAQHQPTTAKSTMTTTVPTSPSSSPRTAKT
ncbi:MAG: hypothetical protein Q605_AUC00886G0003 [Actinomyces urogenitalis DORA_12]|uniref:Uncharacterized protein n=1 Tax=Actinomyces urogenitalis DORA_12 TaxID=1403939 RepID=W1VAR2_9ACTO|nr:MAG: hypothetical protein Q605_AUC00886G0003 [Actinomyces urogenitalis DORA_12]